MAFVHGKNSVLWVDNVSAVLTNISQYVDNVEGLPGEIELADVTAFGDSGHKNIPGLENVTFSASGSWDAAVDAILGPRRTATATFEYGPAGGTTGLVKYSGEMWINSYTVTSEVGDKVAWEAEFTVDGVVARGTWA